VTSEDGQKGVVECFSSVAEALAAPRQALEDDTLQEKKGEAVERVEDVGEMA